MDKLWRHAVWKEGISMADKAAKTIAEYAIRKWLEKRFAMECFSLEFNGNEATLVDRNNESLHLVYDHDRRLVYERE